MNIPAPPTPLSILDSLIRRGDALRQRVSVPAYEKWRDEVRVWLQYGVSQQEAVRFASLFDVPFGPGIPEVFERLVGVRIEFLQALRGQMLAPPETSSGVKLFVSHSSEDVGLARDLVDFILGCIDIPDRAIRCTSVPGFKLETGVSASETLRAELRSAPCVVGLVTPRSANAAWVLFELGARWGQKLHVAPVLHPRADFAILPGPLREHHAVKLDDEPGMLQLIDELADKLGLPKRGSPLVRRAQSGLAAVLARLPTDVPVPKVPSARAYGEADIKGLLDGWLKERPYADAEKVIHFAEVDTALGIPAGSAKTHLERVAADLGYAVNRKGGGGHLVQAEASRARASLPPEEPNGRLVAWTAEAGPRHPRATNAPVTPDR